MGKVIVELSWNGDGPAHSGSAVVRGSRGRFFVEDDVDTYGPFETLGDALALDMFHFGGTPAPALTCSREIAASAAVQASALDLAGGPRGRVWINGVRCLLNSEGDLIAG